MILNAKYLAEDVVSVSPGYRETTVILQYGDICTELKLDFSAASESSPPVGDALFIKGTYRIKPEIAERLSTQMAERAKITAMKEVGCK